MGQVIFIFTFTFLALHAIVRGLYHVVISDYINEVTKSSVRATVLSAQKLIARLFLAATLPLIGILADVYSVSQALSIIGITTLLSGGFIMLFLHRYKII